ncbi:helix-turn-helix domain-containing protein [Mammaliicoccus vitulinus]|uniref:helix-turn-helix domain-containing protein n=1 Tax=Mammaliicoccus vitulinus TaxID=71237 RepID=UPI001866B4EC|nr:helix-turn-helix transcriptional regulator [Mammaliicoccus vitulinus]
MDNNNLGEYIKKLRSQLGVSNRELARRANISQSYMYNLENGRQTKPTISMLNKLANAFSEFGFDKTTMIKEIALHLDLNDDEINQLIKSAESLDKLERKEFYTNEKLKRNLTNVLDTKDVYQDLKYTVELNNNKTYTISLGDNIRQHIKSVVDEIVKMHVYNNPEVLKNNEDSNQEIDWNISINKLKIIEEREEYLNVDNEVHDKE